MVKRIAVSNLAQARRQLRMFAREGYNVFRGQRHTWPVRPSLFRLDESAQSLAVSRLNAFLEWCVLQPRLSAYRSDPIQLVAIAQHYGIPTPLLDATYSPSVALFFALHDAQKDTNHKPVVFAWRKAEITQLPQVRVLDIQVDNLWRLEAQHGLFIEFADTEMDGTALEGCELIFDKCPRFSSVALNDIYPPRKSLLETVLDIYFCRESTQSVLNELTKHAKFVMMKKWQSYEAAFNGGTIVLSDEKLKNIDQSWFSHNRTPYGRVGSSRRHLVRIDASHPRSSYKSLEGALNSWKKGERPNFEIVFWGDTVKDKEISKAFNHVFDGVVAFPYSKKDRIGCLATCLRLLPVLRKDQIDWVDEMRPILGQTVTVEFAASGGRHLGCAVSRRVLENALDNAAYRSLRPFFRRYLKHRKLDLLCFCLDHIYSFRFPDFFSLFATQVIPSQFAGFLHEHLALLDDGGALWDLTFDPIALGYFSTSRYQFDYPFALEEQIDRILFLFDEMEEQDILDEIILAAPRVLRSNEPLGLRIHGFAHDSREIWEIPRALNVLRIFAAHGGMSILEVFTLLDHGGGRRGEQKAWPFFANGSV